jgi:hypothetical protein
LLALLVQRGYPAGMRFGQAATPTPATESGDWRARLRESLRWYGTTWSSPRDDWRGVLGLVGFVTVSICLDFLRSEARALPAPSASHAALLAARPGLLAALVLGVALWGWASLLPVLRAGRDGRWALVVASALLPLAAFLMLGGPGWPGAANERFVWAAVIAAELALTFRPSRAWAYAAALGAGAMAWLIWG